MTSFFIQERKQMNRIAFLLIIIALLNVRNGLAQTSSQPFPSTYEVQKVPANPDVAQLGRFGDIPVNKYNGTANISVPIYEIDHDGLKIPIALKYNTSGIKVEQEASWVGLGWSLSEGMTITRDVNGFEDIYNSDHPVAESVGWIFSRDYLFPNPEDGYSSTGELSEMDLVELQFKLANGTNPVDTEPDFFTVNLPSGSCKFTLPKIVSGETSLVGIVSDNKNFKVLYDYVNFKFTITDPNGFVYNFDVKDLSTGYGSYEAMDFNGSKKAKSVRGIQFPTFHARDMISSWRVSKITSPRGRDLNFIYEAGFYFSYPHFSESHDILTAGNKPEFLTIWNQVVSTTPEPNMFANMTAFNVNNLSLITGDFGTVDFVFSDRSDLVSKKDKIALSALDPNGAWNTYLLSGDTFIAKKVDQIIIKNKADEIIRSATLNYSYFNSQWLGVRPVYNGSDPFECDITYTRLKLDRVDIGDQKYQFEYYQPNSLPSKYSRSVDFWGFNNGINNATKVPGFNRFYTNHPGLSLSDEWHEFFVKVSGGNRGADVNYGKIGALQKVTYPTGGYTIFDYEGNKVSMSNITFTPTQYRTNGSGQFRFTNLTSSTNYKYSYQYLKLAKTPTYTLYDYSTCKVSSTSYNVNTNFQVNETAFCNQQNFNIKINATISWSVGFGQASPTGRAVWIRNVNTGQEYDVFGHNSEANRVLETTMSLPVGTYQLMTANWTQNSPLAVVNTSANIAAYSTQAPPQVLSEEFEVGGTRIKSISNYNADGAFISKSNYLYDQYVTENGQQVSNGKLMDELIFHSRAQNLFDYTALDFGQNLNGTGAILSSENKIRTNPSAGGSHIGYTLVREEKVDALGNKLGQTVTEYTNKPNEYVLKPTEYLPRITLGVIGGDDFHTTISDLSSMGISYYPVQYGSVYILGARPITYDYLNGSMVAEKIYSQTNSLVRETSNTYNTVQVLDYGTGNVGASAGQNPIIYFFEKSIIHFQPYLKIQSGQYKLNVIQQLVSTTTTEYLNGNQLTNTTNYYYDNPAHFLMTRSSTTPSDGNLYTTKYYYPKDLPAVPFMSNLVTKNEVSSAVVKERYKGTIANPYTTLLEKAQTFYSNSNSITGDVLPKEVFTYSLGDAIGQQRVLYEKYSNYGTLIQYRKNNENTPVSLLWGHYKLLPIAQITNAQSDQVAFTSFDEPSISDGGWEFNSGTPTTITSKTGTKCLDTGGAISKSGLPNNNYVVGFWGKLITGSSGTVTVNGTPINITDTNWKYYEVTKSGTSVSVTNSNVYIDELRLYPVGGQMTSYTYKPLVGITSQTDPSGDVNYYEYDSYGRLLVVRDSNGDILKANTYNYKK
jgi:YD repeat-containing protein